MAELKKMPEKSKTLPAKLKRLWERKRITIKFRDEKGREHGAISVGTDGRTD
jgi:hypothetical protein